MSLLRGRTWLMRGGAIVVLAALVGAWALGLAEAGGSDQSPPPNVVNPVDRDDSPIYDIQRSRVVEKSDAPRTRQADPSPDAVIEPIVDTADEPTVDDDETTPTGADPTTPAEPDPSLDPGPSPTSPPSTNPPSQPEEECTDLASTLNCVLNPVTHHP